MQKFRIYATKIEYELDDVMTDEDKEKKKKLREKGIEKFKNSYTIDHTVLTYLMDDQNAYLAHLGSNMNEYDLASTIVDKILNNERGKINRYK